MHSQLIKNALNFVQIKLFHLVVLPYNTKVLGEKKKKVKRVTSKKHRNNYNRKGVTSNVRQHSPDPHKVTRGERSQGNQTMCSKSSSYTASTKRMAKETKNPRLIRPKRIHQWWPMLVRFSSLWWCSSPPWLCPSPWTISGNWSSKKITPDVNHHNSVLPRKGGFLSSHQIHKGNVNEETSCKGQNPSIGLVTIGTDGHADEESKHRSEWTAEVEKEGGEPVDATPQQNGIITCGSVQEWQTVLRRALWPFSSLFL